MAYRRPVPAADPVQPFRRALVYGVTGSGKSTAAARVAERTGLPHVSVDDLTWLPGWVAVERDEQRPMFTEICAGEEWVLDSAYGTWRDVVLARADLVVALDYPRWRSLWSLVRRTVHRAATKQPICGGNTERWRDMVSRESILVWHFKSYAPKRDRMREWAAAPDGPPVLVFRRRRDLVDWVERLSGQSAQGRQG